jgi:hypothetical protein
MLDTVHDALERIEALDSARSIRECPDALTFLKAVYRNPSLPLSVRMRAAIAALPCETPKLAVTATTGDMKGFAAQLEAARRRSGKLVVIDAKPEPAIEARSSDDVS